MAVVKATATAIPVLAPARGKTRILCFSLRSAVQVVRGNCVASVVYLAGPKSKSKTLRSALICIVFFSMGCHWPRSMWAKRVLWRMAPIHDFESGQRRLAALPLASYGAGETVFTEGTKTGRPSLLKSGAVSIVKGGVEIAKVAEPGAVFGGELSALLDQPHSADVRALKTSEFHVADAAVLLQDPAALLYVTMVLARRIDAANRGLLEVESELEAGEPRA